MPILIENVEDEIPSTLDNVLLKKYIIQAGKKYVKFGDIQVELAPTFNVFLTTKLPNPHYLPHDSQKVKLLNFTVTHTGLRD